jgi:hypothetical protein
MTFVFHITDKSLRDLRMRLVGKVIDGKPGGQKTAPI